MPLTNLFPAIEGGERSLRAPLAGNQGDDTSSEEDDEVVDIGESSSSGSATSEGEEEPGTDDVPDVASRPIRDRRPPARYRGPEWVSH